MPRRSIEIEGFHHSNPIPAASRIGPLIASSVIIGRDAGTNRLPKDADDQIANLFRHMGDMLAAAGADWRHIVKVGFYVPDLAIREAINGPWLEHFPDPGSRPARHTQHAPGVAVSCEFLAYVDD